MRDNRANNPTEKGWENLAVPLEIFMAGERVARSASRRKEDYSLY